MPVKTKSFILQQLASLVTRRAVKYHCGFRTAFIQWTSEEEKRGVSYEELKAYVDSKQGED